MKYYNVHFVVSGILCLVPNYSSADVHQFVLTVSADNEHISGHYSLDLGANAITNISLSDKWTAGEGDVQMTGGGIGLNKITLQYNLQGNSVVNHNSQVISSQVQIKEENLAFTKYSPKNDFEFITDQDLNKEANSSAIFQETGVDKELWLAMQVTNKWELQTGSRTVLNEFQFNKVIFKCSGYSLWTNGSGHTALTGGIGGNTLFLVNTVPEDESGNSAYSCEFSSSSKDVLHGNKKQINKRASSKAVYAVEQIYGSIYENGFISWQFNQDILSIEGGAEWKNGNGTFEIVAGGVGHDILEFKANVQANSFGVYSYTVKFRI